MTGRRQDNVTVTPVYVRDETEKLQDLMTALVYSCFPNLTFYCVNIGFLHFPDLNLYPDPSVFMNISRKGKSVLP